MKHQPPPRPPPPPPSLGSRETPPPPELLKPPPIEKNCAGGDTTGETVLKETNTRVGHLHQTNPKPEEDDWKSYRKEDDLGKVEKSYHHQIGVRKRGGEVKDGQPPPPSGETSSTSYIRTGHHPDTAGDSRSTQGEIFRESCSDDSRADIRGGEREGNKLEENISIKRDRISSVTVNGIDLMVLQKIKKDMRTPDIKAGKKQPSKKKDDKLTPAPSSQNIRKYLEIRKQQQTTKQEEEEQECKEEKEEETHAGKRERRRKEEEKVVRDEQDGDDRKKTFSSVYKTTFQTNIQKFRMMSRGTECQIRSGFCSSHNVKVMREVVKKRMGNVDELGKTSWSTQEACILTCPKKPEVTTQPRDTGPTMPEGTNGKKIKLINCVMNQPKLRTDDMTQIEETE